MTVYPGIYVKPDKTSIYNASLVLPDRALPDRNDQFGFHWSYISREIGLIVARPNVT